MNLNSSLIFTTSRPVRELNSDSIEFTVFQDTVPVICKFTTIRDSNSLRKFSVTTQWEEDARYRILLKPGTIYDMYGKTNDSTGISFTTRAADFYGRILLDFSGYAYPMIVQVRNEKGTVVRTAVAGKAATITFDYLVPGRYSFKAIYDANSNGKWDTGNYLLQQQPERTFLSGKPQQLRSNWDWEANWSITENSGE